MAQEDPKEQADQKADEVVKADVQITESTDTVADTAAETADPEVLAARLEDALTQIDSLRDQALRGQADAENARRRAAKDVENAHKFALEKFAGDLLPVVDSLEKAVERATDAADPGADLQGVELALKLFLDVLARFGVKRIDPLGEPFDPQQHEAMAAVAHPDSEPNSVIEVMQAGYTLNDRLVRAAMVVVSKAPQGADGDASA
jgi:molecular chaperone GrpE